MFFMWNLDSTYISSLINTWIFKFSHPHHVSMQWLHISSSNLQAPIHYANNLPFIWWSQTPWNLNQSPLNLHLKPLDTWQRNTTLKLQVGEKYLPESSRNVFNFWCLSCWRRVSDPSVLSHEYCNTLGMLICFLVIFIGNTWMLLSFPSNQASILPWC